MPANGVIILMAPFVLSGLLFSELDLTGQPCRTQPQRPARQRLAPEATPSTHRLLGAGREHVVHPAAGSGLREGAEQDRPVAGVEADPVPAYGIHLDALDDDVAARHQGVE